MVDVCKRSSEYEHTTSVRQLGSIQDFATSGYNEETGVCYLVIGDGHGIGKVIIKARRYNWSVLGELPDVDIQTLVQPLVDTTSGPETSGDGMTASIVRCIPDKVTGNTKVEIAWIGDSSITLAKTSGPRSFSNRRDETLFFNREYVIHPSLEKVGSMDAPTFKVVSDCVLRAIKDKYFTFPAKGGEPEVVNMTGAWGHMGATVHPLFQRTFELPPGESYIVRVATDGWWDMMHDGDWPRVNDPKVTSEDLSELAEKRWRKNDWCYNRNVEGSMTNYPIMQLTTALENIDDIAVGTIIIPKRKHDDLGCPPGHLMLAEPMPVGFTVKDLETDIDYKWNGIEWES